MSQGSKPATSTSDKRVNKSSKSGPAAKDKKCTGKTTTAVNSGPPLQPVANHVNAVNAAAREPAPAQSEDTTAVFSKIMTEHKTQAHAIRQNITDRLESLERTLQKPEEGDKTATLTETNEQIKQLLEKTIKEKLADLEEALKSKGDDGPASLESGDNLAKQEGGKRTPKERSPDLVSLAANPPRAKSEDKKTPPPQSTEVNNVDSKGSKGSEKKSTATGNASAGSKTVAPVARKSEKKERSTVESVLKSLTGCATDAEKLALLSKKYVDLMDENRSFETQGKQQEKVSQQAIKEREQLQDNYNRAVLAKSRLENLCRELQRQNKAVKEESLSKIKEEEDKRREIANKFQSTFNEIMQLVQENQQRNVHLKEENVDLASKLKTLMGHYDNWETNVEKMFQQKDLEVQLVKAKLAKTNLILSAEKEQFIAEKHHLITMITELQKRGTELSQNELQLRAELNMYTSKYEEFQSVLTKSNETFGNFKTDMEKMAKQIKRLEKETIQWKNKWEVSNIALATMSDEVRLQFHRQ